MNFTGKYKGADKDISVGKDGEIHVVPKHGIHGASVLSGRVYAGSTAVAGVAPGTAIGTTGAYTLANPAGSGAHLVVLQASMGYVSGTLGAGMVVYAGNVNPIAAAVTGTVITVTNQLLGGARADGQGLAFTTSTLPVAPTVIRPAWNLDASLATTAGIGYFPSVDYIDGAICVAPGGALTLNGISAAGATPLVIFGTVWEEVDI